MEIALFIGFTLTFVLNIRVGKLVRALWRNANIKRLSRYDTQTKLLGFNECILYFLIFSLLLKNELLDARGNLLMVLVAWLTFKTLPTVWASKMDTISSTKRVNNKVTEGLGSEKFNIYLIGTSLNLLIALAGATIFILLIDIQLPHLQVFLNMKITRAVLIVIGSFLGLERMINLVPKEPTN